MDIPVCQWMCTLLYYTCRYMLIRRAKNFTATTYRPSPSPLLHLSPISISRSPPYRWHLWLLQCSAVPQVFSSSSLQRARPTSLGGATALHLEHKWYPQSGEEQESCTETFFSFVSAPVRWPPPYFSGFVSSINQLSIRELIKKQNRTTATSAVVESTVEFNWKKHANRGEWFLLGHTALTAQGTETSLINC